MSDNATFLVIVAGIAVAIVLRPIVGELVKLAVAWLQAKRERIEHRQ